MEIGLRLRVVLPGFAANYRKFWLVAACALAASTLGGSEPALAQACGPLDASTGSVTCTTGGNPYAGGINYGNTGVPTHITLEPGVVVNVTPNTIAQAVAISTGTAAGTGNPATLDANNAAVTLITPSSFASALFLHPIQGNATITASGIINQASGENALVVQASVFSSVPGAVARVDYTGAATPGIIDINGTGGSNSALIQACTNDGCGLGPAGIDGNAIINATGNLKGVFGDSGFGLQAVAAGNGTATVTYNGGTINLTGGSFSNGIFATAGGSATVTTLPGTNIIVSSTAAGAVGAAAFSGSGATLANVASTIQITGPAIPPPNDFRFQPTGIQLQSNLGPATVNYTGPGITVHGGGGIGIAAVSGSSGSTTASVAGGGFDIAPVSGSSSSTTASGPVTVNASGPINITADSSDAVGILADSGTLRNTVRGLAPTLITGPVQVTASNVSTPGQFGTAISANGGSGGVTVNTSGSIMGGWQATPFGFATPPTPLLPGRPPASVTPAGNISSVSGLPAAGVFLSAQGAGIATLMNGGSIGALSDLAIVGNSGNTQVTNNGTITGFAKFTGDNNNIVNNGLFNLRHFADTTGNVDASGNGVRDTVRVAVTDLGPGTFTNNGTLALAPLSTTPIVSPKIDSTGEYLPLGNRANTMAFGGPLQGQILGATTFTNSGTIDLQANPVPGDVLVITSLHQLGPAPNPLIAGGGATGTFISNGGTLKLDTVLNQGGPAASQSDVLVVDGTSLGAGGATRMFVRNAGGAGAQTVGDGILVVQVLDTTRSAPGAFVLAAGELRAGAFDYRLFHGGVGGSNPADWFLRNDFIPPTTSEPIPPTTIVPPEFVPPGFLPPDPPPEPLPPGVASPILGPEIATYGVVQPLARQLGLATLGTLNDRVGDTYEPDGCAVAPATAPAVLPTRKPGPASAPCPLFSPSVWGRFFGQSIDNHYRAFADPRADGHLAGFQAGIDLLRGSFLAGHQERAGLYVAYGNTDVDVKGLVTNPAATAYVISHTGKLDLDAWSGGAYWTHVGPGGWYLDAVLQATRYGGSASTDFAKLDTTGTGFISSLEGGYPFAFPQLGPGFALEPQAQILWQRVAFDHQNDGLGDVGLGKTSGTSGRVGVRAKWTILTTNDQVWQPYLRVNLWEDWGAQARTIYSGTGVAELLARGKRLQFGGGLTTKINANLSFYANADYEFAVGNTDGGKRDGVRGAVGLRYTW